MKKDYATLKIVCVTLESDVITASGETDNLQKWPTDWFGTGTKGGLVQ